MSDEQKVVLRQLQLSGIGIIVILFGFFDSNKAYVIIGVCIALFGAIRALIIGKLIKKDQ